MNSKDDQANRGVDEADSLDQLSQSSSSERDSSGSESVSSDSGSSAQYNDAEWGRFIEEDGSLMYVESYVSSTVKERQVQAIKIASDYDRKAFPSPPKNLKRHTKLLNLLKRRPSVRVKSSPPVVTDSSKVGLGGSQDVITSPKVTFRDNPSGEVRNVVLKVAEIGSNFGRRATFCETVLGVMPGRFNEPPDSRIMVAGLAPGSHALKDGFIKIGDWLKEVNEIEVNWDNLDTILMDIQIPSTITLSVQKCAAETLPQDDHHHNLKRIVQTRLVKFLIGKEKKCMEWNSMVERGTLPLHVVLHLSLKGVTEESPEKADIRYQFPSMSNKLVQVRGMFLTLSHSLQEVTGAPVVSSTVTLHGVHYHAAFCRETDETFLMVIPHFCLSEADLITVMEQVCKLIRFEFGSLSSGLSNPRHKDYLDHLFLLMLEDLLTLEDGCGAPSNPCGGYDSPFTPSSAFYMNHPNVKSRLIFGVPSLLVVRDEFAKIQMEICLNELQSGDFGDNDSDCEDCLLLYNIIGCCIFYKGHLVLSHLDKESSEAVFLFADRHRLLHLVEREAVSQLVLWRRVFPPQQPGGMDSQLPPGAKRDIDHYLLIVAMNHLLLVTLVESGNVTELMDKDAGPDPFLVDQAETTLYHLHSLHIHTACEESLISCAIETLTLDAKMSCSPTSWKSGKSKPTYVTEGAQARLPDVPSILKQKSPTFDARGSPSSDGDRSFGEGSDDSHSYLPSPSRDLNLPETSRGKKEDTEAGDEEDSSKEETSSDSDWRILKGTEGKASYGSKGMPPLSLRVTAGEENVLLHMVQLDVGEGVIVTTCYGEEIPVLHSQLLRTFHTAVSHIRHILHSGRRSKVPCGSYFGSSALNNVKEYGIMFECSEPNRNKVQVAYWIVGRIFGAPYEREVFVALEDSIAQNMQEIAFKIALGCT